MRSAPRGGFRAAAGERYIAASSPHPAFPLIAPRE